MPLVARYVAFSGSKQRSATSGTPSDPEPGATFEMLEQLEIQISRREVGRTDRTQRLAPVTARSWSQLSCREISSARASRPYSDQVIHAASRPNGRISGRPCRGPRSARSHGDDRLRLSRWITRREALDKLDRARQDRKQGLPVGGDERQTVAHYLKRWLADAAQPTVRPRTYATYESYTGVHLIPALGRVPLQRLGPADVQRMLNAKLAAGLAPRTVHHLRAILRRALNQAVRWGTIPRNAAALVDAPRVPRYEVPVMGPEDARRFLETVRGDRLEALFTVALAVGLRQGRPSGSAGRTWTSTLRP